MSASLSQIGQIAVTVHDLDRAVSFYKEVLGLALLYQFPPKLAFFDAAGVRLMLSLPEEPQFDHPSSVLYFKVDDIQSTWESLREGGADLIREPHLLARMPDHELWMAFFKDSEGNLLALMSEVRVG
ncbi:MAG TPA: VOC family protein [Thermoanaerobaculia bacterium]|nr:VOC family protein [Thermoanaerobaculia bacterium]